MGVHFRRVYNGQGRDADEEQQNVDSPGLMTGTKSADRHLGPRGRGGTSRRGQSQQLNESIHVVVAGPNTVLFLYERLQFHSNALQRTNRALC